MEIRKIKRNKPRIALILDTWFPIHTGEQVYTAKLAKALATDYGYEVDILTRCSSGSSPWFFCSSPPVSIEDIPAIRVKKFGWKSHPWNLFLHLGYAAWVFFYLLSQGKSYRIYHAQSATAAFAMKAASWFTRVPTLVTVHSNHVFYKSWTIRKAFHRVLFLETRYTKEVSISECFLKAVNVNEAVQVVPYGVQMEPFDAMESRRAPEQFNVLYVGRLEHEKGIDVLLQAAAKVIESKGFIQSHKDFSLHLAGEGSDRKTFEKLAQTLGIQKYVRFYGLLGEQDLIGLYKSCDLFVLPSRNEALPLSVLEAGAARLPILATTQGDLRNVVLENVNGHLVEPDDVDELAYYLEHYASNPHLEALGQASYDIVSQEYSWDKSMQKMLRIYEDLMIVKDVKKIRRHDHALPWEIPFLFWRARNNYKTFKGKSGLRFCLTVNLVGTEVPAFLEHFLEFTGQLEIPGTIFVQSDLLESLASELLTMQEKGHELGMKTMESEWLTSPMRRSSLRTIREQLAEQKIQDVRQLRAPLEISEQDLEILHEAGFESLPVSEDPWPHLEFHYGVPLGSIHKMNLKTFVESDDEELLAAVNRLRAYQKSNGLKPYLIFECDSSEFFSHENFSLLSRKLAFLKENMELEFLVLSDFCKKCSVRSE